jgi:hypothetical protein
MKKGMRVDQVTSPDLSPPLREPARICVEFTVFYIDSLSAEIQYVKR